MFFFFFKQKTAYEMRISDWSSDVCSSDLIAIGAGFLLVLDDQVGRFADRAGAETEQHGGVVLGEALEVAVHPALARGGGKRIVGPREVVEADGNIAGGGQAPVAEPGLLEAERSEEHTSELQSLMRISYAVFCLKKKTEI